MVKNIVKKRLKASSKDEAFDYLVSDKSVRRPVFMIGKSGVPLKNMFMKLKRDSIVNMFGRFFI